MSGSRACVLPAVALVLLAACGGPTGSPPQSGTPSSDPSVAPSAASETFPATAAPSATALPSATPAATAVVGALEEWPELAWVNSFVMKVAVSDLNVRSKPSTSAKSDGKAPKGGLFMMYDWPIEANGYRWYFGFTLLTTKPGVLPELPEGIVTGYDAVLAGWMATGTEDTPFMVPVAPRCPTTVDLANVGGMLDSERISCFGSEALTLEGTYGCEGCGGAAAGSFEPEWLASPLEFGFLSSSGGDSATLALHFAPGGVGAPAQGARVTVRGHFSDERATTCRIAELGPDETLSVKIDNDAAAQWCRGKFVVDNIEVIG